MAGQGHLQQIQAMINYKPKDFKLAFLTPVTLVKFCPVITLPPSSLTLEIITFSPQGLPALIYLLLEHFYGFPLA
jgi:hypothetical protein